jgi:hypothetical protein
MEQHSRDVSSGSSEFLGAGWFDPIELAIRDRVRGFIEELVDAELDEVLGRSRYRRRMPAVMACGTAGYRRSNGVWNRRVSAWTPGPPVARFVWPSDDQRAARTAEQGR